MMTDLDLRQLLGEEKDIDFKALMDEAKKEVDAGCFDEEPEKSFEERMDENIINHNWPSMTPGLAKLYRERAKQLQKEGKV